MSAPPFPRLSRLETAALALVAVLPFLNGLPADFTYDDKLIIRDNERIAEPDTVDEIFTTQYFGGSLQSAQNYRPFLLLTYAVQRWIHGNEAPLFRAVNIALHAGVTVVLAAWLLAVGFPRGPTLAAAALFAVVTIHVEAVTSLVGRAELLAALLTLGAALLWSRATGGGSLRPAPYAGCLGLFLAAVFVKESAVILPGLVALGEVFRGGRVRSPRESWAATSTGVRVGFAGFLVPLGVLFAVRWVVLKGFLISREAGIWDLENPLVSLSVPLRIANALTLVVRYAAKTFVPVGLSADHSAHALPIAARFGDVRAWVGIAVLAAILVLAWALGKSRPIVPFGVLFFLGALFPASNVPFVIGTIWAERLMYLPSAGLLLAAVGLVAPPVREVPRPSRWPWREALLAALVVAWGSATVARNLVWRDDHALFHDMVAKCPRSAKAHYNLAYDAGRRGETAEQRRHLETAVSLFPRYYDAWAFLGRIAWNEKRWDDALAGYRRAVDVHPTYENGLWGLAKVLAESGRAQEAERAWDEAARLAPDSYPVAYHRAAFFDSRGRVDEAVAEWHRAVLAGDGTADAHLGLAEALARRGGPGDGEAARKEARRALVADPAHAEARRFLKKGP